MIKKINIGGEERPLCFNFNCLQEFQELTGVNPFNGLTIDPKQAKALIYCGLKYGIDEEGEKDPGFTLKKVGSWLTSETLVKAMEVFNSQATDEKKSQ